MRFSVVEKMSAVKKERNSKMKGVVPSKKKKASSISSKIAIDNSISDTIALVAKGNVLSSKCCGVPKKVSNKKAKVISNNVIQASDTISAKKRFTNSRKLSSTLVDASKIISAKKCASKKSESLKQQQVEGVKPKSPIVRKAKKNCSSENTRDTDLKTAAKNCESRKMTVQNLATTKVSGTKKGKMQNCAKIENGDAKKTKVAAKRRKSPLKSDSEVKKVEPVKKWKKHLQQQEESVYQKAAPKIGTEKGAKGKGPCFKKGEAPVIGAVDCKKIKKTATKMTTMTNKESVKKKASEKEVKVRSKVDISGKKLSKVAKGLSLTSSKGTRIQKRIPKREDGSCIDDEFGDMCDGSEAASKVVAPATRKLTPKLEEGTRASKSNKSVQCRKMAQTCKSKMVLVRKGKKIKSKEEPLKSRKLKLFSFWNAPKRHRVASLNALAKVHCLYENETRGALMDAELAKASGTGGGDKKNSKIKREIVEADDEDEDEEEVAPTRILRSAPGLRGMGKHWDNHDEHFSSSDDNDSCVESVQEKKECSAKKSEDDQGSKSSHTKRRRNRCELIMDLKDMVVRKRMASLNASAILAASYSVEKRTPKSPKSGDVTDSEDSEASSSSSSSSSSSLFALADDKKCHVEEDVKDEDDRKLIEVSASPSKKVSVILNQDTDVTITGVYVNSTTRSTHHEGYCSIAGMQYRISAKSHTQTASTTVATETVIQSSANTAQDPAINSECSPQPPCKSYTPLSALSSMQPPGAPSQHAVPVGPPPQHLSTQHVIPLSATQHVVHSSPIGRRHGCVSAFSAPPAPYGPPPPAHQTHHQVHHHHPPPSPSEPGYIHGYYQPAGPLISVPPPHIHPQPSLAKPDPLSEVSSTPTPPPSTHQPRSQSSNNTTDSQDSDVVITSPASGSAKESLQHPPPPPPPPQVYRYTQYPPHTYPYGYHPQYYPAPPPPATYHHELCYPPSPYLHHKAYPPPTYRRHLTAPAGTPYYQANPPDLYHSPQHSTSNQPSQQVVTANPVVSSSSYQPSANGPPPTVMDNYPPAPPHSLVDAYPPPPPHYYSSYGPAPPPSCYSHSSPARSIPYLNAAAYQACPCPMQSCPKNVHTGPLTGDSKRSSHHINKDSLPLPPVALALPLEPVSATGPPSPARGSAGMPPPPSPAGATYHQPPPPTSSSKQEPLLEPLDDCCAGIKHNEEKHRRKARVGKSMVRNNIAANFPENTMLLMCHAPNAVKREIESPEAQKHHNHHFVEDILKSNDETVAPLLSSTPSETSADTDVDYLDQESTEAAFRSHIDRYSSGDEEAARSALEKHLASAKKQDFRFDSSLAVKKTTQDASMATLSESDPLQCETQDFLPCQKTVAENVKVKNMKRKLSSCKNNEKTQIVSDTCPEKKAKICEKMAPKCNGSYKDLIKKNVPGIKINNGKRKLIAGCTEGDTIPCTKSASDNFRSKKILTAKRKLSPIKEDHKNKRTKIAAGNNSGSKPLAASNLHNSKQNLKINKSDKLSLTNGDPTATIFQEQSENKEPVVSKSGPKKAKVNSKCASLVLINNSNVNSKKVSSAPVVLDNLIAKNNVDKTIEFVVNGCCAIGDKVMRTTPKRSADGEIDSGVLKISDKCKHSKIENKKEYGYNNYNNNSTNSKMSEMKSRVMVVASTKKVATFSQKRSKSKSDPVLSVVSKIPRKSLQSPRWSNGWTWKGEPFQAKIFLNSDETTMMRKCYPAMKHAEGDIIEPRDCVLLKAGPRKNDLPFVAKVAALWENPDDGEMMISLLWYYRPEHTDQGRQANDEIDEVFASRHKDTNSVACIEDKCYVLTFNEYCRYRASLKKLEEGLESVGYRIPSSEPYPRKHRQPPFKVHTPSDLVFFCRRVYDFRQKRISKNPS